MTGPAADPPEPGPAGRPPGPGPGAGGLLAAALEYALQAAASAGPGLLARPTPCRDWDLRMLLRHVAESLAVLQEGLTSRRIALHPGPEDTAVTADPLTAFRARAARLLATSRASTTLATARTARSGTATPSTGPSMGSAAPPP